MNSSFQIKEIDPPTAQFLNLISEIGISHEIESAQSLGPIQNHPVLIIHLKSQADAEIVSNIYRDHVFGWTKSHLLPTFVIVVNE
jgi:hypothetical protein